jgi:hypothetical protein
MNELDRYLRAPRRKKLITSSSISMNYFGDDIIHITKFVNVNKGYTKNPTDDEFISGACRLN